MCQADLKNPITNLFFDNGELDLKYPEKFRTKFVIGSQNWILSNSRKGFEPFDPYNMEFGERKNIEENIVNSLLSLILFTMMTYFYKRVESTRNIFPENSQKLLQLTIQKSYVHLISRIGVMTGLKDTQNYIILINLIIGSVANFMCKKEESQEYFQVLEFVHSLERANNFEPK